MKSFGKILHGIFRKLLCYNFLVLLITLKLLSTSIHLHDLVTLQLI